MFGFLLVLFVLVCLLLGLFILVQSDTGGGISGAIGGGLSSANSAIGAQNTENILTRGTTLLAVLYFGLALGLFVMASNYGAGGGILDAPVQRQEQQGGQEQGVDVIDPSDVEVPADEMEQPDVAPIPQGEEVLPEEEVPMGDIEMGEPTPEQEHVPQGE
ncbi:preprotein translocase subunit SecG [Chitinivibrio alkaliphilus]|uniref:Protein-export membrane protein SecG n=1 Tax=Chitinivibrio alkaliphilus ACht1 TaxID=1313304 RepID=U7D543_9BACT|nr:preprotein translocase subunit SecG [Chitinivibrio alkaliphilus]ERP31639.1 preprotein translocase subunit SecG [Chitinivibrio alkaliphilus ACht1]